MARNTGNEFEILRLERPSFRRLSTYLSLASMSDNKKCNKLYSILISNSREARHAKQRLALNTLTTLMHIV